MPNKTLEKWEEKTINDVCIVERGSSPRPIKDFITTDNNGVNWIKIGDCSGKYVTNTAQKITQEGAKKSRYVKVGDFIISNSMSYGKPYILKIDGYIHDGWFVLRLNNDLVNTDYFYYLLSSNYIREQYDALATGAIVQNISSDLIKKVTFKLPPLQEQQRIVGILNESFENIEKAKQNALQNLNNAKELFESYLDKAFTENTDNWNKYKVKDVCKYAKEQGHYNLPYVGMEHIKGSTAEFIGSLDNTEVKSTTFHFDKGIILYGRLRPYLRKVILTTFEGHCSTELFPIKVNDKVNNKFLMYWLLSQRITDKINATWTGARMPRANMNKVLEFDISIPSIMEQQKIVAQLDELQEQTKKLEQIYEQKIKDLDELKQSILQKAFNGEL